jgi:hypothetical protein
MENLEQLIQEGASLKSQRDALDAHLKQINQQISGLMDFNGKKTAHAFSAGHKVTVQLRENVRWDQTKLEQVRESIGNDEFLTIMRPEWKPRSKKDLDGYLAHGQHAEGFRWAMEVREGAPLVKYEALEEEAA